jgi:hypothetical protein
MRSKCVLCVFAEGISSLCTIRFKIQKLYVLSIKRISVNTVLHQPNALIYLKNTEIFFKILDKKPLHMFRLIDKLSSGGITTACF